MRDDAGERGDSSESIGQKREAQEIALLFAGVVAAQSLQSLGHASGLHAISEGLAALIDIVARWKGASSGRPMMRSSPVLPTPQRPSRPRSTCREPHPAAWTGRRPLPFASLSITAGTRWTTAPCTGSGDFASRAASLAKAGHIYLSPEARDAMHELKSVFFVPLKPEKPPFPNMLSLTT